MQHIEDEFHDRARKGDGNYAIAFALLQIAKAQERSASALRSLGTADAATPLGAVEFLAVEVRDAGKAIAAAISEIKTN